jgi:hypothetical protein
MLINEMLEVCTGDQMVFRKGQAALDFLMTYGWAIALVVIIAAVLFSMGLFDTSNFVGNKATGFSGVAVKDWSYAASTGGFSVLFSNQVGQAVIINGVTVSAGGAAATAMNGTADTIQVGANSGAWTTTLDTGTAGNGYTASVVVSYQTPSGFNYTSAGTLTGKMI